MAARPPTKRDIDSGQNRGVAGVWDWTKVVGVLGDALTCLGGLVLAWKEFRSVKEFEDVRAARRHLRKFPENAFRKGTKIISDADDLQSEILADNARGSRWGVLLLVLGFLFLLGARIWEGGKEVPNKTPQATVSRR